MMKFFEINTTIGLWITGIIYGLLLILWVPTMVILCKETNKNFWYYANNTLKDLYGYEKPQHPIKIVLIFIACILESIFLWEVHYLFLAWLIYKEFQDDKMKSKKESD